LHEDREEALMLVIESELQFVEIQGEALWGDAMVFHEPVFGIASAAFQAIDVYSSSDEMFPRVHLARS
jgi:hypothetical protein